MTPRQIELVKDSWQIVLRRTQGAGVLFSEELFEIDPDLRMLFQKNINSDGQKLVALITFAVHKIHNLDELIPDVSALGRGIKKYRVHPGQYMTFATALLATLEKTLDDEWNDELTEAWRKMYSVLSKIMIRAGKAII